MFYTFQLFCVCSRIFNNTQTSAIHYFIGDISYTLCTVTMEYGKINNWGSWESSYILGFFCIVKLKSKKKILLALP